MLPIFAAQNLTNMQFRRLTNEELQGLEPEFIQFLASNTVTAQDWVKLKADDPGKANQLLEVFSDIVFTKIIDQIVYMEFRAPNDLKTFHCLEDKILLNGLHAEGEAEVDLTSELPPSEMMEKFKKADVRLRIYTAEKEYRPDRATEIFRMLETGATIAPEGSWFKLIEELKA